MNTSNTRANVLFVDDEIRVIRSLKVLFSTQNQFVVHTATNAIQALKIVRNTPIHVLVSDQRMPEITGVKLLKMAREISPNTVGILLTGYADINAIVASINEGEVYRYITKPWNNQELKEKVQNAVQIAHKLQSVSNVPMLGQKDTPKIYDKQKQGILVLHPENDNRVAQLVNKLFSEEHEIHAITNIKAAIDKMISEEIAVVVSDISKNNANWTTLIKILKQSHPMSLSVVVTDSADANVAISLINQGQVYRYLPKPVQTGRLKLSIWSALRYYQQCKAKPIQVERHQVEDLSVEDELVINSTFVNRLAHFKNRIFGNFASTRKV